MTRVEKKIYEKELAKKLKRESVVDLEINRYMKKNGFTRTVKKYGEKRTYQAL